MISTVYKKAMHWTGCNLRAVRDLARTRQVDTDVAFSLGSLSNRDTRQGEALTGSIGGAVDVDNRVTSSGDRTRNTK